MPPVFYVEVRNKRQDFKNSKPTGKERTIVTRYCTEFMPDPERFLEILDKPEWAGIEDTKVRASGMRPISIQIEPGNWDVRIDWQEVWEEFDDTEGSTEQILGLTLYNVSRTYELPTDRATVINLSSQMWGGDLDKVAHFQKLGMKKEVVNIDGTAIGRVNYNDLLEEIKQNKNVVDCSLTYSRSTNTTAVSIRMESDDE